MMLRGNLEKIILVAIICAAVLYLIIPFDFILKEEPRSLAFIPHLDPETAEPVFSGTSSLMFDSDYLDFILQMNPEEVEAMLEKMASANIPQSLKEATDSFASSGISISHLVVDIEEDLSKLRTLREQFRLDEAIEQAAQTSARLSQANSELKHIEQATEIIDEELKVASAPEESVLRQSYDEILDRIHKIREMLALYEELLKPTDITLEELLKSADITLEIQPMVAFVGDNIRFKGTLTSEGKPLAGREVDILLNSSRHVTVKTDAYGHYQGILQVPYWYIPELKLQALYYPRDKDVGLYLASLSRVIKVKVLFYEASLEVTVEDKAYPGLETTVTGRFDYGQSPPLNERKVEIYVDDVLITEAVAQEAFVQEMKIDPEEDAGKHIITVSSAAVGRYSPVVASVILNVVKATPILDLTIPKVAMIPGSIGLGGKLYSEVGPLSEASIKMELGKSHVELVSYEDGTFDTEIRVGTGFNVIGSQDLVVQVFPEEPWHAPLATTRNVLMVNTINCAGILAILIFLGIYVPSRLRGRPGAYPTTRMRPAAPATWPELLPTYSNSVVVPDSTKESSQVSAEPRNRIFYWYRLVVRLVQGITKALLKPQQTLREFAKENSKVLGPAAKYFVEFTKRIEGLLYSQYSPTEGDVENSKQLFHKIEEEFEPETATQPVLPWDLQGDGRGAQLGTKETSFVRRVKGFNSGDRNLTTSPWGQLSNWLWVLLIIAVAYYACLLFFLVPLLVISLAPCLPLVIADDLRESGVNNTRESLT